VIKTGKNGRGDGGGRGVREENLRRRGVREGEGVGNERGEK